MTSPGTLTLIIYLLGAQARVKTISDQWWRHPWWRFENPFPDRHWHLCVVSSFVKNISVQAEYLNSRTTWAYIIKVSPCLTLKTWSTCNRHYPLVQLLGIIWVLNNIFARNRGQLVKMLENGHVKVDPLDDEKQNSFPLSLDTRLVASG